MPRKKILEIGSIQKFTFNELTFDVEILDTRKRRSQEYLIKPVTGSGQGWVETFIKKYNKK